MTQEGRGEFVIYDPGTGRIICSISTALKDINNQVDNDFMFFQVDDDTKVSDATHYIKDGDIKEKKPIVFTVTYHDSGATVSEVTANCYARIEGNKFKTDGDDIVFNFDKPGTYSLFVESVEYMDTSIRIDIDG